MTSTPLAHAPFQVANPACSPPDYTLNNPDTLTKYKTAAQISEKVLAEVSKLCVAGSKIVDICEKGDKLIEEEIAKVYRGKKITKGTYSPYLSRDPCLLLSLNRCC